MCTLPECPTSKLENAFIDVNGIKFLPACSNVDTNTCINDVSHNCGRQLIETRGWEASQQEVGSGGVHRVGPHFGPDQQASRRRSGQPLADANRSFDTRFRAPLNRYNVFPRTVRFSTLADAIKMVALEADATELAAPSIPPARRRGRRESANPRIHVQQLRRHRAADLCLDKETLYDVVLEVTEDADRAEEMAGGESNWMMKFAHAQPLSVEFVENGIKLVFRGLQFWKEACCALRGHERVGGIQNREDRKRFQSGPRRTGHPAAAFRLRQGRESVARRKRARFHC